jgi:aerobic-type carbon monoxide dehydrogenase small subunit (CoxS/CutS family)
MAERDAQGVQLILDGVPVRVPPGTTVAAALANHGRLALRRSVTGSLRAPLCGMGTCHECRATVDGRTHVRTCTIHCREGMRVQTDA